MRLLNAVLSWLSPTCDVPGCDSDPDPLWVDGGLALLCAEHAVDYAIAELREGSA